QQQHQPKFLNRDKRLLAKKKREDPKDSKVITGVAFQREGNQASESAKTTWNGDLFLLTKAGLYINLAT
ncbi:MAG: hypothetical protein EBV59_06290, partial [Synechococcaceae bacterium WB7_1C_051]|nr:hypothetical protein [Synechococcaceae bacterium WB7_1C_051]